MSREAAVLRALLEASTDNIFMIDREGRYEYVSRGGAAAVGMKPADIVGQNWRDLGFDERVMKVVESHWQRVFSTGDSVHHEVTYDTPSGRRWFEYHMFPILDLVAVVARDVTDRIQSNAAVARAAERYRGFVAHSTEGIWRFELDEPVDTSLPADQQIELIFERGYLAECNDVMARMYGYQRAEEIAGARLVDMLDPKQEGNREYLRAFIEAGYALNNAESIETDRNGNRKYFMNSLTGIVEQRRLLRAWGTQRDMTEEKAKADLLRRSEERLQALVSATTQTIWTARSDGALKWVAPSWTEITGQTIEEARGDGWLSAIHPDDRESAAIPFWTSARDNASDKMLETELRVRLHDGSYRWFQVRAVPLRDDDGTIREWVGANIDIDARHREQKELALRKARAEFLSEANDLFARSLDYEETLRSLAQMAVPRLADWCGVDMVDQHGALRRLVAEHLDPEMKQLAIEMQAKYPPRADAPRGAMSVVQTGKTQWIADIPDDVIANAVQSPEHLEMVRRLQLKSWICVPIRAGGAVAGVLTLVNGEESPRFNEGDVLLAEQLAARAGHAIENARLYQHALEANRAKDEFLATLSHELRTPLTSILGWANLLRMSDYDPATLRTAAETIERSAKTQARLIDDLLDVSRIVTGKLRLDLEPVDAVQAIENGVEAARPAAAAKKIDVAVHAPSSLPIRADANRLQQIVWNLMSNAVKFSTEGSRIDVIVRQDGNDVVIQVRDQGIGIQETMLSRVFDRFWQADSSSQRQHSGLGLGLAIVKYLAELHGGSVRAESEGEGKGATFTVTLPMALDQVNNRSYSFLTVR